MIQAGTVIFASHNPSLTESRFNVVRVLRARIDATARLEPRKLGVMKKAGAFPPRPF